MSEKEPGLEAEVLQAIQEAWSANPNMRLMQLLINAIAPKQPVPDLFYVEDSRLIRLLNRMKDR